MARAHGLIRSTCECATMVIILLVLTQAALSAQESSEAGIGRIDRNRDTLIGRSEYHNYLRESFFLFDADKNGVVNAAEISVATKQRYNDEKFSTFDANDDGGLDINEFQRALSLDFEAADSNKDGALSGEEFGRYFD